MPITGNVLLWVYTRLFFLLKIHMFDYPTQIPIASDSEIQISIIPKDFFVGKFVTGCVLDQPPCPSQDPVLHLDAR